MRDFKRYSSFALHTRNVRRIQEDPPEGIMASPLPENIMVWNAVIFGPEDTPFEDGEGLLNATIIHQILWLGRNVQVGAHL